MRDTHRTTSASQQAQPSQRTIDGSLPWWSCMTHQNVTEYLYSTIHTGSIIPYRSHVATELRGLFISSAITHHFISLEPAFWATIPLYSTVDCTLGGSKESRGGTVTLYGYPATAKGCYVGASSSQVAFRAIVVESSCSVVAAGFLVMRVNGWGVLQKSASGCWVLLAWGLRFVGAGFCLLMSKPPLTPIIRRLYHTLLLSSSVTLFPWSQPSGPHSRCTIQWLDCLVGGSKESRGSR
jgi:hypothetical protein